MIKYKRLAKEYMEKADTPLEAARIIAKLLGIIEFLEEQDRISEGKLIVCRTLNNTYKEHVMKLIEDSEKLKNELQIMADTNFGLLHDANTNSNVDR